MGGNVTVLGEFSARPLLRCHLFAREPAELTNGQLGRRLDVPWRVGRADCECYATFVHDPALHSTLHGSTQDTILDA